MRNEAKEDRLAVVRMKKKRYGIKTKSKEESMRFKEMSERKVMLAKARGYYGNSQEIQGARWKRGRGKLGW